MCYAPGARSNPRQHFLSLLASVLASTQYYPHEFAELVLPSVQADAAAVAADPTTLSIDIAHLLAFRRGLGNSLFASPASPVSVNDVKSYAQQAFAKSNLAVIGTGISTEALAKSVDSAFGGGSGAASTLSTPAVKYYGGEHRVPFDGHGNPLARPTVTLAFGSESAPSADLKVLPYLLGGASSVKWNAGTAPLSLLADKVRGSTIDAKLYSYSDASLFAITVSAPTNEALKGLTKDVVSAVQDASKSSAEDVKKAVAKAKFAEASKYETVEGLIATAGSSVSCDAR